MLEDSHLVKIAFENHKEDLYHFTGCKEYQERKIQQQNEQRKQREAEYEANLKKMVTSKLDKNTIR